MERTLGNLKTNDPLAAPPPKKNKRGLGPCPATLRQQHQTIRGRLPDQRTKRVCATRKCMKRKACFAYTLCEGAAAMGAQQNTTKTKVEQQGTSNG